MDYPRPIRTDIDWSALSFGYMPTRSHIAFHWKNGDVGAGGHETERESRPVDVGADGTGIVHKKLHLLNDAAAKNAVKMK